MKTHRLRPDRDPNVLLACLRRGIESELRPVRDRYPHAVRLALNEAEAVAWQTGLPHLTFPALAREKVEAVLAWHRRQEEIFNRDASVSLSA